MKEAFETLGYFVVIIIQLTISAACVCAWIYGIRNWKKLFKK